MVTKATVKATGSTSGVDRYIVQQLEAMGFSNELTECPRRLVLSISGREKSGKSHFAFTAPEPIFLFNIDIGTEGVLEKFQSSGRQVYVYDVRVPRGAKKEVYEGLWGEVKARIDMVYKVGSGTLVMDTATEGFELARLAHFGKLTQIMPHHYTLVNAEWREFLRLAYDSTMNTILIHKMKPKYINNARTGEYEASGFGEIGYLVQCNATAFRETDPDGITRFNLTIEDCRQNPSIYGTTLRGQPIASGNSDLVIDPMVNLKFLLTLVHGR